MSAWLDAFHFLRPWWLLLALLWLPLLVWRMRGVRRGAALSRLADAELLPHLLVGAERVRRWPWLVAALAGTLATLALAGPTWQRLSQPLYRGGAAQVVVVSLSQRMLARDVQPDRMQRVRYKVHDLLHANASGRNGLVAYAGAAFTVAPLTTDAHALDDLVDALAPDVMPVPGNNAAKGIARGVSLLRQGHANGGSMVVVTDTVDADAIDAARQAHAKGIRVSVLGVGTADGAPVRLPDGRQLTDASGNAIIARRDDASLKKLADVGGGIYVSMRRDHADIHALAAELQQAHRASAPAKVQSERWRDFGPWLLLPLALLAALAFRRGWLLVLPLALLPYMIAPAHAADPTAQPAVSASSGKPVADDAAGTWRQGWSSLWRNADQRAAQALANGHPQRAERLAQSPALRGSAAYRAGDYAAAAKAFSAAQGADAAYNLGNALARQGHYRKAIKAYDKALKRDPHHADARANRKAVRDWLRKHQDKGKSTSDGRTGKHGNDRRQAPRSDQPNARKHPAQASSTAPQQQPATPSSQARPHAEHGPDAEQARKQQAEARRASRALGQRMQGKSDQRNGHAEAFDLGAPPAHDSSTAPLPKPMQRALERVQDDPGGLLRRKFLLEYRQRQGSQSEGRR